MNSDRCHVLTLIGISCSAIHSSQFVNFTILIVTLLHYNIKGLSTSRQKTQPIISNFMVVKTAAHV